jgi:hypothetical protein
MGAWPLILVFAFEALHVIPARLRFLAKVPQMAFGHGAASFYGSFLPLLDFTLYLLMCQISWDVPLGERTPKFQWKGFILQCIAVTLVLATDQIGFRLLYGPNIPEPIWLDWLRTMLILQATGFAGSWMNGNIRKGDEARARLAAAQVSPHAIFNVLATVEAMVHEDRASDLLDATANYLRGMLEAHRSPMISLRHERSIVTDFLRVQAYQIDPLKVEWDWDTEVDKFMAPPLVLQSLVENAVRHGIRHVGHGTIKISTRAMADRVLLSVVNSGPSGPLLEDPGRGSGLENLKARLSYAFGKEAAFSLSKGGEWTIAEVMIPRRIDATAGSG